MKLIRAPVYKWGKFSLKEIIETAQYHIGSDWQGKRFQGQLFVSPELLGFSMRWLLLKCFEAPQTNTLQSRPGAAKYSYFDSPFIQVPAAHLRWEKSSVTLCTHWPDVQPQTGQVSWTPEYSNNSRDALISERGCCVFLFICYCACLEDIQCVAE